MVSMKNAGVKQKVLSKRLARRGLCQFGVVLFAHAMFLFFATMAAERMTAIRLSGRAVPAAAAS